MRERTPAERLIMKLSVAKHYGWKGARHCGLIADGRSQANRDVSCVRNMNCCVAHCAAIPLSGSYRRCNERLHLNVYLTSNGVVVVTASFRLRTPSLDQAKVILGDPGAGPPRMSESRRDMLFICRPLGGDWTNEWPIIRKHDSSGRQG